MISFLVSLLPLVVLATQQPILFNLNTVPLDYDTYSFESASSSGLFWYQLTGNYTSTGRPYSAFVSIFASNYFSFLPPTTEGCVKLIKTSESSKSYECEYATNGAFFTWDTSLGSLCKGNLISDGYVWQLPTDGTGTGRANFGITRDNKVIAGFIDADVIANNNFTQLITGWGWLVRGGKSYVNSSSDILPCKDGSFCLEKAPRTSIGFFKNGSMALVQIDGEEDIEYGPDLFEVAEIHVDLGVEIAINLDGGGSSVSVYDGEVIDAPTCNDTPEICEREVASITCVKK